MEVMSLSECYDLHSVLYLVLGIFSSSYHLYIFIHEIKANRKSHKVEYERKLIACLSNELAYIAKKVDRRGLAAKVNF